MGFGGTVSTSAREPGHEISLLAVEPPTIFECAIYITLRLRKKFCSSDPRAVLHIFLRTGVKIMVNQQQVFDLFEYRDGHLYYRKIRKGHRSLAGGVANTGYWRVNIDGKKYQTHRLIYLMFYGRVPEFVDHIDGDKTNNRIENLRAATRAQNQHNRRVRHDSVSGSKNVRWDKKAAKWRVVMRLTQHKQQHIGFFDDFELAKFVASEYHDKYHGDFARHG